MNLFVAPWMQLNVLLLAVVYFFSGKFNIIPLSCPRPNPCAAGYIPGAPPAFWNPFPLDRWPKVC